SRGSCAAGAAVVPPPTSRYDTSTVRCAASGGALMAEHILAIDQGTTSSRAIVFDKGGRPVASAQREFEQHYPKDGWVEHAPETTWRDTRDVCREALGRARLDAAAIAAIGVTNQRETVVLWERASGKPVSRAIVWQD